MHHASSKVVTRVLHNGHHTWTHWLLLCRMPQRLGRRAFLPVRYLPLPSPNAES